MFDGIVLYALPAFWGCFFVPDGTNTVPGERHGACGNVWDIATWPWLLNHGHTNRSSGFVRTIGTNETALRSRNGPLASANGPLSDSHMSCAVRLVPNHLVWQTAAPLVHLRSVQFRWPITGRPRASLCHRIVTFGF